MHTAPTRSVHYVPTDPGTDWVKDPGIVIDVPTDPGHWKVLTPNVIALPTGGFRMYYTLVGPAFERVKYSSNDWSDWLPASTSSTWAKLPVPIHGFFESMPV